MGMSGNIMCCKMPDSLVKSMKVPIDINNNEETNDIDEIKSIFDQNDGFKISKINSKFEEPSNLLENSGEANTKKKEINQLFLFLMFIFNFIFYEGSLKVILSYKEFFFILIFNIII